LFFYTANGLTQDGIHFSLTICGMTKKTFQ
jgi:hypothetical protein